MNNEIVEYLNRYDLTADAKWVVSVMVVADQGNFTLDDLKEFTDMRETMLLRCVEELNDFRIVGCEQRVDDEYYFVMDIRVISMAAKAG